MQSDEDWLVVADAFNAAAVGSGSWVDALTGLARATGSRGGQLVGFGSENAIPFNWATGVGREWCDDFLAHGGADPSINPILRAAVAITPLTVRASAEFISLEERRTSAYLQDFAGRQDTPYICITPLIKDEANHIGVAVLRSHSQGEITAGQRAAFSSIAPHIRAAVKTQLALEHQGALLVAGALEALSLNVFVCDGHGVVKAMTPAAETLAGTGGPLQLRQGKLGTASTAETQALTKAIAVAAIGLTSPGAPLANTVIVRGGDKPLVLDVLSMPRRERAFGFEARVLVVVRGNQCDPKRMKGLLQTVYRLTGAEAEIALRLAEGHTPEAIAAARNTSVNTTRIQIKSIFGKLGVSRQTELVARLRQFF